MTAPKRGRPPAAEPRVLLVGSEWLTIREIARRAGVSGAAVRSRIARGVRGLDLVRPALATIAKPGRPRAIEPREGSRSALLVRLTATERRDLERYAAQRGEPLSVAIREAALRAARWRP